VTFRYEAGFWLALLAICAVAVWLLSPILLPFVLGMAIGYVVDPVVVRLERAGLSRAVAAGLLVGGSFLVGVAVLALVTPLIVGQIMDFAARLPAIASGLAARVGPFVQRWVVSAAAEQPPPITDAISEAAHRLGQVLASLAAGALGQGVALVNLAGLLAVTPLVAFYLLRDWPKVVAEIDSWLPRRHVETIRAQAREIDRVLAGFARGATIVCAASAAFYALALTLVGLDFGLVIGLVAGAVSFVPYLGATLGFVAAVGTALAQFWPAWTPVAIVAGIFVGGQIVQDYALTPWLVGDRTGLHPLWVLFGMLAGATVFGFVGLLAAVPACAAIGVLARFAIGQYKRSAIYRGTGASAGHGEPEEGQEGSRS
jgi:predicted PurR-regulated permease PerM